LVFARFVPNGMIYHHGAFDPTKDAE